VNAEYHMKSIRCCFVREEFGGIQALESILFARSVAGLMELGWNEERIAAEIKSMLAGNGKV
jgi:hypothetical protein